MVPSSPPFPCKAIKAKFGFAACKSAITSPAVSIATTSTPIDVKLAITALPLANDTSRSAALPPINTATRPLIFSASTALFFAVSLEDIVAINRFLYTVFVKN